MFRTFAFMFAASLSLAACASSDGNEVDDSVLADAKADGSFKAMRTGTYDVSLGLYYALTLHDDGTFHLQGGCKPNPDGGPNCFAIATLDGDYKFTKSGSSHYLRLNSSIDDSLAFKLKYVVSGSESEKVALTNMEDHSKSSATLENADKHHEGESCGGFTATPNLCEAGLECVNTNGCCDLPGTCQPSK